MELMQSIDLDPEEEYYTLHTFSGDFLGVVLTEADAIKITSKHAGLIALGRMQLK